MTTVNLTRPDVTLRLTREGLIVAATVMEQDRFENFTLWHGRPWHETVTAAGVETIRRLVDEALSSGVSGFAPVQQMFPSGAEIPLEYTTVSLGERDGLIAIGRRFHVVADVRARLIESRRAMESNHWRLRESETSDDLVFNAAADPMLLLDAGTSVILQANPAAIRALGADCAGSFLDLLPESSRRSFATMLRQVRADGQAPGVIAAIGPERISWIVRTTLIETGAVPSFLLHLTHGINRPDTAPDRALYPALIARLPDGFIVIDGEGVIQQANVAFLELVEAASESIVTGQRLERWLKRGAADAATILDLIRNHGTLIRLPIVLRGEFGAEIMVELSASAAGGMIGIMIHDVSRMSLSSSSDKVVGPLQRALQSLSWDIGTTTIHTAVDETVELVERHFIGAALAQVAGNRKAAAALIGLSRQSLYLKMNRYGLE
jgi:transcriptional regulator PpsR